MKSEVHPDGGGVASEAEGAQNAGHQHPGKKHINLRKTSSRAVAPSFEAARSGPDEDKPQNCTVV